MTVHNLITTELPFYPHSRIRGWVLLCPLQAVLKAAEKTFKEEILKEKSEVFMKSVDPFKGYEIVYRGLSIDDM